MTTNSMIERYPQNKRSSVAIKPYFDPSISNLGLERYGMVVFDGAMQEEPIMCLERHGIIRYVTGLNEFAPEVKALPDDERKAKIKQIRVIVAQLEKELISNIITDLDSEDFWNQVKLLRPDNGEFWDKIKMKVGNEPVFLEPKTDPYDLIKLYAIEAGGFSLVAPSLEKARTMNNPPKFYLDKVEETASTVTEIKKVRNRALAELQKLFDKNQTKLFYVAKVVDINSTAYRKATPNDVIYDMMDKFINGESTERDKRKSAQKFLDAAGLEPETLKIQAMVKDASQYKIFAHKSDGFIYDVEKNLVLGKTQADVIEFLKNPLNEETLKDLLSKLERYWNA